MSGRPPRPAPNPFATRHTQPGCVPPLDAAGRPADLAGLLSRLREHGGCGAIVGPHGSGKTNLLAHLAQALAGDGGSLGPLRIRSAGDAIRILRAIFSTAAGTVVCLDSWEQAGPVVRFVMRAAAAWRGCGLLVTSHAATTLPTLVTCRPSPEILTAIVATLPAAGGGITHADIDDAFERSAGNVRDALADLYDRFESRRSP